MRMRRPRPSTLVWRSLEGFLATLLLLLGVGSSLEEGIGTMVVEEEVEEGVEEWARFLDWGLEMEPMKGPWPWEGGVGADPEPGSG